jgi:hypothetical protein
MAADRPVFEPVDEATDWWLSRADYEDPPDYPDDQDG